MNIVLCVLTCLAFADKAADLVSTYTLVQTRGAVTLIHLYLTKWSPESCINIK